MKISGNCRDGRHVCPFLRTPTYHSGFTGKSGPETWNFCKYNKDYPCQLKSCDLAAQWDKQKDFWIDYAKENS